MENKFTYCCKNYAHFYIFFTYSAYLSAYSAYGSGICPYFAYCHFDIWPFYHISCIVLFILHIKSSFFRFVFVHILHINLHILHIFSHFVLHILQGWIAWLHRFNDFAQHTWDRCGQLGQSQGIGLQLCQVIESRTEQRYILGSLAILPQSEKLVAALTDWAEALDRSRFPKVKVCWMWIWCVCVKDRGGGGKELS